MEKFNITLPINEDISSYMCLLMNNVMSRQRLISSCAENIGIDSPVTKAYEREFYIYDCKYNLSKEKITASIPEELRMDAYWNIDFMKDIIEITLRKDLWDEYIKKHGNNSQDWIKENAIIDKECFDNLNNIYNTTDFDDEAGIINE